MQQEFNNNKQEQSSEIYQSISSNEEAPISQPLHLQGVSETLQSRSIVFQHKPQQINRLFGIYQQNLGKISQLRRQIEQYQNKKLQKLRQLNYDKSEVDSNLQQMGMQQVSKIDQFKQNCLRREKQLKKLRQLYSKLNEINQKEVYLLLQQNHGKMLGLIQKTKEVICYKVVKNHLITLTRNKTANKNEQCKSESNLQQSTILFQQKTSLGFTIAIFQMGHLLHWMSPKDINFELDNIRNEDLIKCKQSLQRDINIVKKINIVHPHQFVLASYSHKHKLIFAHQQEGTIIVFNLNGEIKSEIHIDRQDELIMFEPYENQLFTVTKQGIVRIHLIQQNGKLTLSRITRCCKIKNTSAIKSIKLQTQQNQHTLIYSMENQIYQYSINNSIVTSVQTIDSSIYISLHQSFIRYFQRKMVFFNRQSLQETSKRISKYLEQNQLFPKNESIIHLFLTNKQQQKIKLLTGNPHGALRLIIL